MRQKAISWPSSGRTTAGRESTRRRAIGRWSAALAAGGGLAGGGLASVTPAAPAGAAAPVAVTCTGALAPGTYLSITVPAGQSCAAGVGPLRVLSGVDVGQGSTFTLGYEGGPATGTIGGGLTANGAAQVQVHNARINGGVDIQGGVGPFGCSGPVPTLCFTDLEDNSIHGGATINGYNGFFLGFIRNAVDGTTAITNNTSLFDGTVLDQIDIGSNVVHGNLVCSGNDPTENTGDSPGPTPDVVTGHDSCHEVTP